MNTSTRFTVAELCTLTRSVDDVKTEIGEGIIKAEGHLKLDRPTDFLDIQAVKRDKPGAWWKVVSNIEPHQNLSPQSALAISGAFRYAAMQATVLNAAWAIALPANIQVHNRALKTGIATMTHEAGGRPYEWSLHMHHSDEWLCDTPLNTLAFGTRQNEKIVLGEVRHVGFYGRTTQARTIYAATTLSPVIGATNEEKRNTK